MTVLVVLFLLFNDIVKFSRPQNLITSATSSQRWRSGGGIHEQTFRLSCKANRGLEWVVEDYQGGKIIEAKGLGWNVVKVW
jgi:hypothetical protein